MRRPAKVVKRFVLEPLEKDDDETRAAKRARTANVPLPPPPPPPPPARRPSGLSGLAALLPPPKVASGTLPPKPGEPPGPLQAAGAPPRALGGAVKTEGLGLFASAAGDDDGDAAGPAGRADDSDEEGPAPPPTQLKTQFGTAASMVPQSLLRRRLANLPAAASSKAPAKAAEADAKAAPAETAATDGAATDSAAEGADDDADGGGSGSGDEDAEGAAADKEEQDEPAAKPTSFFSFGIPKIDLAAPVPSEPAPGPAPASAPMPVQVTPGPGPAAGPAPASAGASGAEADPAAIAYAWQQYYAYMQAYGYAVPAADGTAAAAAAYDPQAAYAVPADGGAAGSAAAAYVAPAPVEEEADEPPLPEELLTSEEFKRLQGRRLRDAPIKVQDVTQSDLIDLSKPYVPPEEEKPRFRVVRGESGQHPQNAATICSALCAPVFARASWAHRHSRARSRRWSSARTKSPSTRSPGWPCTPCRTSAPSGSGSGVACLPRRRRKASTGSNLFSGLYTWLYRSVAPCKNSVNVYHASRANMSS